MGWYATKEEKIELVQFRTIASEDCKGIVNDIINPRVSAKSSSSSEAGLAYKIKNLTWNKIFSTRDFDNFNENDYFKWMAIYQDAKNDYSNINPASIEQKLALIEVINSRLIAKSMPLSNGLLSDVQSLNQYKLSKLQGLIKSIDLSSKVSRSQLAEIASEFALILKGPPITLLDYFSKNKTERMNERLLRMIQEDVLLMGLKGVVKRIPEKNQYTRIQNAKYLIDRFFKHKVGRLFILPYDLPWIESMKIPDELLEKILLDGLAAHNSELVTFLKSQNKIDMYERFRKVYKPIAFSLGVYLYTTQINDKMSGKLDQEKEEEKQEFLRDFENVSNGIIETNTVEIKSIDQLKQDQFDRIRNNYRMENNRDLSPEDLKELRAKIFKE